MSRPDVDLVIPELVGRDATSEHTLRLWDLLTEQGRRTRIVAERADDAHRHRITPLHRWRRPAPVIVLQHAIGSVAAQTVIERELPVVVDYHNITPAEFFEPWDPHLMGGLRWGRQQLEALQPRAVLGLGDSAFNVGELVEVGFERVGVAPILFDGGSRFVVASSAVVGSLRARVGEGPVWLFVGRVAPNKAQHDVVRAFAVFREWVPSARLVLVGGVSSPGYGAALEALVGELGLGSSVVVAGSVSDEELAGWYAVADVFVCLSEHEGFCVPVLEAMFHGVPVVAFGAGAVPETVGSAGVVLGDKSPVTVAVAVESVLGDAGVREVLVAAGRERVEEFSLARTRRRMLEHLGPLLDRPPTP